MAIFLTSSSHHSLSPTTTYTTREIPTSHFTQIAFYLASFPRRIRHVSHSRITIYFLCLDYLAPTTAFFIGGEATRRHQRLDSRFFPLFSHPPPGPVFVFYYFCSHDIWRSALLDLAGTPQRSLPPPPPPPPLLLSPRCYAPVHSIFAGAP